jgi:photosystem II stability/assembly factor-like uncharacterized protein
MKNLHKNILLILCGISMITCVKAQWTQTAYNSGYGAKLISAGSNLYIASAGGIFKSTDNAETWAHSSANIYNELGTLQLTGASMVSNSAGIYMMDDDMILRSNDNGNTWNDFMNGIPAGADLQAIYTSKDVVYLWLNDSGYELFKLSGTTWTSVTPSGSDMEFFTVDTFTYSISAGMIYRSSNGENFSAYNMTGLTGTNHSMITGNATRVFIIQDDTTIFSSNNGGNWSIKMGGMSNIQQIMSLKMINNILLASTLDNNYQLKLYRSDDFGLNWTVANTSAIASFAYFFDFTIGSGGRIIASAPSGIYASADNGVTWVEKSTGYRASLVAEVATAANGNIAINDVYKGVYVSSDGGANWTRGAGLPTGYVVFSQVFSGGNMMYVYLQDYNELFAGLYKSSDNGVNWSKVVLPPLYANLSNIFGFSGSTAFFGVIDTMGVNLIVKTNDGVSFTSISGTLPVSVTVGDIDGVVGNGTNLYAWVNSGVGKGVYISSNGGTSWSGDIDGLSSDPNFSTEAMFYAGADLYLYADTSNSSEYALYHKVGPDWIKVTKAGLADNGYVFATYGGTLYAFNSDSVFYSMNQGANWSSYDNSGFFAGIEKYSFAVNQSGAYITTYGNGVWKSNVMLGVSSAKANEIDVNNYPNPTNDLITFDYTLNITSDVKIELFDFSGKLVRTILNERQSPSNYTKQFHINDLSQGVYTYRITTAEGTGTGKITKM